LGIEALRERGFCSIAIQRCVYVSDVAGVRYDLWLKEPTLTWNGCSKTCADPGSEQPGKNAVSNGPQKHRNALKYYVDSSVGQV